jgi:arylsulfatase A-like enzyme
VIDIVPTILEVAGIRSPKVVDGVPQKPIEGVSMMWSEGTRSRPGFAGRY